MGNMAIWPNSWHNLGPTFAQAVTDCIIWKLSPANLRHWRDLRLVFLDSDRVTFRWNAAKMRKRYLYVKKWEGLEGLWKCSNIMKPCMRRHGPCSIPSVYGAVSMVLQETAKSFSSRVPNAGEGDCSCHYGMVSGLAANSRQRICKNF